MARQQKQRKNADPNNERGGAGQPHDDEHRDDRLYTAGKPRDADDELEDETDDEDELEEEDEEEEDDGA